MKTLGERWSLLETIWNKSGYWEYNIIWCAWIVCHARWTLPKNDIHNLNESVRAGIVFG